MLWVAIAAGGALGALARHVVNGGLAARADALGFPLGIAVVNGAGCLAIGVIAGLLASGRLDAGAELRAFLVVGLLGGFTTFSSFALDTFTLLRGGHVAAAALNAVGQTLLGIAAVWIGFLLASLRR